MKAILILHIFSLVMISLMLSSIGDHVQNDYVWSLKEIVPLAWFLLTLPYIAYLLGRIDERSEGSNCNKGGV